MVAPATNLPTLTPKEEALLHAFIAARFDLASLNLPPADLLTLATSPAIQSHLAALKSLAESAFELRSLKARTTALDTLEEVARTAENLVERRRAATAIIRPRPVFSLRSRAGAAHSHAPHDRPREHNHTRRTPSSEPSRIPPTGAHTDLHLDTTTDTQTHLAPPTPIEPLLDSPPQPAPTHNTPTGDLADSSANPSPALSTEAANPHTLIPDLISHLLTPRDPVSIATITSLLAAGTTLNNAPDLSQLPDVGTLTGADPVETKSTDTTFTWSARLHFGDTTSTFQITLTQEAERWLISQVDHHLDTG